MPHTKLSADDRRYLVQNPKEVARILNDLAKRKATLNVSFNHGNDSFLTTVIAVDDAKNLAYFDLGRDETFNTRLMVSHDVKFNHNDGIETRWTSADLKPVTLKDGKAFYIALPRDLLRIQRREYHRLLTPATKPVICRIPTPHTADAASAEEAYLELPLADVSVGGIGTIASGSLDHLLSIGAEFNNCKIDFPNVGTTNLTLRVRWLKPLPMRDDSIKHRVGLEFINPSRGNQSLIQRYTFMLESETLTPSKS